MIKKATLLIKSLHKIYTMEDVQIQSPSLKKGFIAIHHDEILEVGSSSYEHYIDKDTRIIDGTNHIAIPSFIEVDAKLSRHELSSVREQHEYLMRYMLNGTLSIHTFDNISKNLLHDYHYEVLQHVPNISMKLVYPITQMKANTSVNTTVPFCISCKDAHISLQNQMMAAQLLAMKEGISAIKLLESLTVQPAKYLNLSGYGKIQRGFTANILLLSTSNIHDFFYSLDQNKIAQIIHKGVRIYPNLLI